MTYDVEFMVMTVGLLFWTVTVTIRMWMLQRTVERLERDAETTTNTLVLAHQLAEMHEREIERIEAHVGLLRVETPKIGPYR